MAETKQPSINDQNPEDKPVAFFAGRANPPTPGHIKIMIQMLEFARIENMIPRIYLSTSYNQEKKDITHITNDRTDSNLRQPPYHTHVKHKKYENPLRPEEKKNFVVEMLHNVTGIPNAALEKIVVVSKQCQPLYYALSCVSVLQSDKEKQYYFMGKEKDEVEAMRREKDCEFISHDNGVDYHPTENISGRYKCVLVSREDDPMNAASGMSGSKIRFLVASKESVDNENSARAKFREVYSGLLNPEQSRDMFDKIKQGMLFSSQREEEEQEINNSKRSLKDDNKETGDSSRIKTGGRKTKRNRKTKRKMRPKKRKTRVKPKKRKKTKRKRKKNFKKRTKKR